MGHVAKHLSLLAAAPNKHNCRKFKKGPGVHGLKTALRPEIKSPHNVDLNVQTVCMYVYIKLKRIQRNSRYIR